MNCGVGWNLEFLYQTFPKVFVHRDMRDHREGLLLEREKAMLPATIPYAEDEKRKERIMEEITELDRQKAVLYDGIAKLDREIRRKHADIGKKLDTKQKREFIRACPASGCKGFLSTSWKCGLCNVWVCPDCHEIKGENKDVEHTCDPEILKSVKMLNAETRPCPTCASLIFKIDGCSQMWCTECHTAFDWKTGQVEKGVVHNPHYYEYLRKHGNVPRNIGDVPCGGIPSVWNVSNALKRMNCAAKITSSVLEITRLLNHVHQVEIPAHPVQADGLQANLDLRVRYLLNRLEEEDWKKELQKREKKNQKNTAHRLIFDMIVAVGIDFLNKILACKAQADIVAILPEFNTLRIHANDAFIDAGKMFNRSVATHINDAWYVVTTPLKAKREASTSSDEL